MDMSIFDLSSYAVDSGGIPQAYYIPEFVSEEEEAYLLRQIHNAPKPKWKNLENRRLQVWGGDLTPSNKLLAQELPPFLTKYPDVIGRLRATGAFSKSKHGAPNHVIVNEYLPWQGIMPHEDGSSYHPVVATISLGSHTVFHYYRYKPDMAPVSLSTSDATAMDGQADAARCPGPPDGAMLDSQEARMKTESRNTRGGRVIDMSRPVLSLLLEPRSLVITTRELYTDHLHGINPLSEDILLAAQSASDSAPRDCSVNGSEGGVCVANWKMVVDPLIREVVMNGGILKRGDRISLTCRDVGNVVSMKSLR